MTGEPGGWRACLLDVQLVQRVVYVSGGLGDVLLERLRLCAERLGLQQRFAAILREVGRALHTHTPA